MADDKSTTKADAEGIAGNKEGEKLDMILSHLDSLHKRMDAADKERADSMKRLDAACNRMDSWDKARKDAEDQDKKETKADAEKKEEEDKAKADAARKDAEKEEEEKKAKADAAKADAAKADAARADSADWRTQIAELAKRIPTEMQEADRAKFVDVQSKAERVAQAFGDSVEKRWVHGETLPQYRVRMASKFKQHSPDWKDVDLSTVNDSALAVAEKMIYADAWQAAIHPVDVEAGTLREVTETDRTGRKIHKFYGDPGAAWDVFKQRPRLVTGWNTKFN